MGYAEKRGTYWRARYKMASGSYGTVKDSTGATVRFRTKREAEQAANEAEVGVRNGRRTEPAARVLFEDYVNDWYARQDLAASTMQNYRRRLEEHLLPAFQGRELAAIQRPDVLAWERKERASGYADSSIRSWRALLHLVFADALEDGLVTANPVAKRRGRGKRVGRAQHRAAEKVITDALGVLLVAERAALLSGRDDEFVAVTTLGFTGMRWGELVGLETKYVRPSSVRVEWQLYELDNGVFERCPPKDESRRTITVPGWLSDLLGDHVAGTRSGPCGCHGHRYVFSGHRAANHAARQPGPRLADVARRAGVSVGTVSGVLNGHGTAADATRVRVEGAIADLGYVRGVVGGVLAPHWRRNGFATWLFRPAATGWYPGKAPHAPRPVPLLAEPWPGVPVRGRNAAGRAECCWAPVAPSLTPHGLRHSYKTMMVELGTPATLMDAQMGHADGSVQALYAHITAGMTQRLLDGLTDVWRAALAERRRLSPGSPVGALDQLLRAEG
ncbi:LacI family DNA-binding transcriptional regulator [Dactylosporangium sp. AC04546]|uniref:LacI family DNA-binding transcriptional regulator n=1 Tax=Dactylosporangium sp. AC04546 TaxID=2862460 RepID=UPI001EDF2A0F|nr:LacI family DNA-binding transcriptional regulator [Dactylosporangium sp. AC04546]WVK82020.1 LacI family DNA-binding transcriptional regulator [Dactylosporangium sp. AC04546]